MYSVISGDIVSSTSFTDDGRALLESALQDFFNIIEEQYQVFSRVLKGDYVEMVVPQPEQALEIALALKCLIKALPITEPADEQQLSRFKIFKNFGIRLAIGYGELTRFDKEKGIIDGEAIYFSGRAISKETSYNKERVVIKNTLFFISSEEDKNQEFEVLFSLIDVLLNKATAKQCEVVYWKLLNYNEEAISKKLGVAQSVVNQHSSAVGWNAIEKAVNRFRKVLKQ